MTGIDWSDCSIVETDPEKMGGLPTVRDWRITADSLIENHDDGLSAEEIAAMFELPVDDVRAILAYAKQTRPSAHLVR